MEEPLLLDFQRAGLYHAPAKRLERLASTALAALQPCRQVALGECRTLEAALQTLGKSLAFPEWYGANLDALYDCLTDPDWQSERGLVLLLSGLDTLRSGDPEGFSQLIEVLTTACEARADADLPCWIILDTPARGVTKLPAA